MSDGLIYLPPMAASYFRTFGFGLVDASTTDQKPCNCFDWGEVHLHKRINSFQPFDSMDLEVDIYGAKGTKGNKLTETVAERMTSASPMTRIILELDPLPLITADGLIGRKFSELISGTPPWLAEALEQHEIAMTMNMIGRTQLISAYCPIREATSLKVRVNLVESRNFQTILAIEQAMERYRSNDAAMNYD